MNAHIETRLSIPPDHAALPGHFPGQPVVPGVVLLDRLIEAAEASLGRPVHVTGLPQVKFLAPLLPGEEAHAVIDVQTVVKAPSPALSLRFRIEREGAVIAQGVFTLAALSAEVVAP